MNAVSTLIIILIVITTTLGILGFISIECIIVIHGAALGVSVLNCAFEICRIKNES